MKNEELNTRYDYQKLIKLGIEQAKNSNFNKSINTFNQAIRIDDKESEAYINLANIFIIKKNFLDAFNVLKKNIDKYRYDTKILLYLWKISINFNISDNLEKYLDELEKNDNLNYKNREFLYFLKGRYYALKDHPDKAIDYFKKSISINIRFDEAYINLLDWLERLNRIDDFEKNIKIIKKLKINNVKIKFFESLLLNRKKNFVSSEDILNKENLEDLLKNDDYYYTRILNLKSKNNENLGNYKVAFESIEKRNIFLKTKYKNQYANFENISQTVNNYKKIYNRNNFKKYFNKLTKINTLTKKIVFLVGFPRSGTTLLDTILRTHSNITVLEEKPYLPNLRSKYFSSKKNKLDSIKNISENDINFLRKYYLDQIKIDNNKLNEVIVDKIPLTIAELGFVKIVFPEAKIILAVRHPRDVIISCFFTSFKSNEAMNNFLDWNETIKFYDKIFDLFEFYKDEINIQHIEIKYERVVKNFKSEVIKLLKFLDLKFEKDMEKFYLTARKRNKISTPSYSQVVNPLYITSVGRWKKYKNIKNLEVVLQKWVNRFNY